MKKLIYFLGIPLTIVIGFIIVNALTHDQAYWKRQFHMFLTNIPLHNDGTRFVNDYDHLLTCSQLNSKTEVDQIWKENVAEFYNVIEYTPFDKENGDTYPGRVRNNWADIDWNLPCDHTGDLAFIVDSISQKEKIREKYPHDFHGTPYRIYVW